MAKKQKQKYLVLEWADGTKEKIAVADGFTPATHHYTLPVVGDVFIAYGYCVVTGDLAKEPYVV